MKPSPLVSKPALPHPLLCVRPDQAAAMLGVSKSTLDRLTQAGELEYVKLKRAKMYPVASLEAWVDGRRSPSDYSPNPSPDSSELRSAQSKR